ncbi:hypothetical protein ASG25_15770 [Rhizobium sp. Leaf384]|nr:hypothetical protein ASG25_15770 [Rhizobium sp. Leaf384]KQS78143.1 hypothetical protein ASG58_06985 [Rhizobium sp. Leaf383]
MPQFGRDEADIGALFTFYPLTPFRRLPSRFVMSVSAPPPLSFLRRAGFGLTIAAILVSAGSAMAGSATARGAVEMSGPTGVSLEQTGLALEQTDDALFPLGKPPALIEATGSAANSPMLWLDNAPLGAPDQMSTGAILSARQLASLGAFALPGRILPAERHIAIGLMLLAGAAMATVSFGLWRWQVRGLSWEA